MDPHPVAIGGDRLSASADVVLAAGCTGRYIGLLPAIPITRESPGELMPQTTTASKKVANSQRNELDLGPWGSGHHNLVVITDYATGDKTFRAETEVRRTEQNRGNFAKLEELLRKKPITTDDAKEIVSILHEQVDAMPDDPRFPDGKQRAKAIFSAAFGELKLR